jgi:hypothetical protein
MRALSFALSLTTAVYGSAAVAQPAGAPPPSAIGPTDTEKVKQVFVYGDDPCPPSSGEEIVVCARMPDNERYRIPKELRTDPNSAAVQSWANRARSIEYVGAEGINSCSPTGAGGFTGCFAQIAREAKEERQKMLGSASWADAVAKAREERLGNLDAESAQIEAQAKAEEEDAARRNAAQQEAEKARQQGPAQQP